MGRVMTDQKGESLPGEVVKIEVVVPVWTGSGGNEVSKYADIPLEIGADYQMVSALLADDSRVRSGAAAYLKTETMAGSPSTTKWRTSYMLYNSDLKISSYGSSQGNDQSAFYMRVYWNYADSSAKLIVTYCKI